ncbi:MAG: peptidoglycan-binding protein, partial [Sphaerochaetaceae bacterium]|nr:peptidoglycan-binding protein [Sphaerochaetaceae bacterium]
MQKKLSVVILSICVFLCFSLLVSCSTVSNLLISETYPLGEYEGFVGENTFLGALDKDAYWRTYELLLINDEIITIESKSEAVTGLQTTLNGFGKTLKARGVANKATFKALNEIQQIFGLEVTDYVDAEVYKALLPALLVYTDVELAEEVYDYSYELDYGQFRYLRASLLAYQGYYWEAYQEFYYMDYLDSEIRAQECIQEWPHDGVIWKNKGYSSTNTE